MNIVSKSTDYVKLNFSDGLTTLPASFTRCPGCYAWRKPNHFVLVPAGLIDETGFSVCIKCAITIRHAFAVRNEKTVRDVAAIVTNVLNYSELWESVE